ncbi:MAG: hypothetical protein R2880_13350 [Deinococcales bacterium]
MSSNSEQVYQAAWYGDGQDNWSPDPIEAFGALAAYHNLFGDSTKASAYRYAIEEFAPGVWMPSSVEQGGKTAVLIRPFFTFWL